MIRSGSGRAGSIRECSAPSWAGNRVGDPNEIAYRASVVGVVDPAEPVGMKLVQELTVGPTAEAYDFTEPCAALR